MDKDKVYLISSGPDLESYKEMIERLQKNGNEVEIITPEEAERRAKMLRHPPLFVDDNKAFKISQPHKVVAMVDNGFPSKRIGPPITRPDKKIQNNDPCHCGSGKKFKNCCRK